jgi:hypothetical protein
MTPDPIAQETEMFAAAMISGNFADQISLLPIEVILPDGSKVSTAAFCLAQDMDGNTITADTDQGQECTITPVAILMDRGMKMGEMLVPPEGVQKTCACGECYGEDGEPTPEAAAAFAAADEIKAMLGELLGDLPFDVKVLGPDEDVDEAVADSIAYMESLAVPEEQPWPDRENLAEDGDEEE